MFRFDLLSLFFIAALTTSPLKNSDLENFWIVWDVGQGQWVTHVLGDTCRHYDAGGEIGRFKYIKPALIRVCGQKENKIFLSHWDFDHYLNVENVFRFLTKSCWELKAALPKSNGIDLNDSIRKTNELPIATCLWDFTDTPITVWEPVHAIKSKNDSSAVIKDGPVLLPGDSPAKQEKIWITKIKSLQSSRILVLGHHGSRTSTSESLLRSLPNLKMAIASARKKKYGHPHDIVVRRLTKNKTPILKTEDWGSLYIY